MQWLVLGYDDGGGGGDDGDDDDVVGLQWNCSVREWLFEVTLHRPYDGGDADGDDDD